jgi:hypothetical protein
VAAYFAGPAREILDAYAKENKRGVRSLLDVLREYDKLMATGQFEGHTVTRPNKDGSKIREEFVPGLLVSFEEQKDQYDPDWKILEYCLWAPGFYKDFEAKSAARDAEIAAQRGLVQLEADLAAVRKQARADSQARTRARKAAGLPYTLADEVEARHHAWDTRHEIVLLLQAAWSDREADFNRPAAQQRWIAGLAGFYGTGSLRDLGRRLRFATASLRQATAALERASRWLKAHGGTTPYTRGKLFKPPAGAE